LRNLSYHRIERIYVDSTVTLIPCKTVVENGGVVRSWVGRYGGTLAYATSRWNHGCGMRTAVPYCKWLPALSSRRPGSVAPG